MKGIWFIIIYLLGYYSFCQSKKFIEKANDLIMVKDTVMVVQEQTPIDAPYDFIDLGSEKLEQLFLSALKSNSKLKDEALMKSATLSTLSQLATEVWKGAHYKKEKKWKKLSKYFKRAASRSVSGFNFMKEVSFRISLIDNYGKKFYYDKDGTIVQHNLYSGKKPIKNDDYNDEDYIEPKPLSYFSEKVLVEKFLKEVKRKGMKLDLKRGLYSFVGLSVVIDENTLYRNRIPTIRIVVIFGARRLKDVKVK